MLQLMIITHTQHETLEALLERGEKLDDLVSRTDKLSTTSKAFYNEVQQHTHTVQLHIWSHISLFLNIGNLFTSPNV